jgi:serine/threonine-protein kinase
MASVWLARDERLHRLVAVKVISDTLAADPAYVARFAREARVAASLSHPNLVSVFDFEATDGRPFLVMEYVEGSNLADQIDERAALPAPRALAEDLLNALAHIHEAGILHRDVKAANVLIASDGRARLTDFGVAQPQDATRLTGTGHLVGTLKYIAPEVVRGEPYTPRSDLYSCGVLLRGCVGQHAPDRLTDLLDLLSAPDPADRPTSAKEALRLLGGEERTGVTRPLETTYRAAPTDREATKDGEAAHGEATKHRAAASTRALPTREVHLELDRTRILAALLAAAALLVLVLVLVSGGGGSSGVRQARQPKPGGTPLERQLDALEREVRAAPSR